MVLPLIDVGLMNEHLSTHEGLLGKVNIYLKETSNEYVKKLLIIQQKLLKSHIRTMLELLKPDKEQLVKLPNVYLEKELHFSWPTEANVQHQTKAIMLELQSTAKSMAHTNFNSALMMKNENVKQVHFEMAIQQATYMNYISYYIKEKGWSSSVKASADAQKKIIDHFQHLV